MSDPRPHAISLTESFAALRFLPNRRPGDEGDDTDPGADERPTDWYDQVATCGDGGIFIVHYAGDSEWEIHRAGDEIVMVVDGSTTMTLIIDDEEVEMTLGPMEMIVVPQSTWHRFHTPDGVKVMTMTPQPTEHRLDHPLAG